MPTSGETDPLSESPYSELSVRLIEHNYREIGCNDWTRPRFWRLCGKMQRTIREMAALMRVEPAVLEKRLKDGFTAQDALILTILDREIDQIVTGRPPTKGIFLVVELKKETAA